MEQPPNTEQAEESLPMREAMLPPKLRDWRAKLSEKAKLEKRFRFYSLYGMVSHRETLKEAWHRVRANNGAPGVDGVSVQQVEKQGVESFLKEIEGALRNKSYRCAAVRRVYIQKENGKWRPLGIPTVRDRVVQTAVKLILEPIFEADFKDCSFGFRPGRNAHQAMDAVMEALRSGRMSVYDADLEGYFDSIPHDRLIACIRMRVVDGGVLGLIRQWLRAVVVEQPKGGGPPTARRNRTGTPQGGVISPLLANIYLHWLDVAFAKADEVTRKLKAVIVRYADDFVVMAAQITDEVRSWLEEKIEGWLGLKINREKTRVLNLRKEGNSLDFLGYSFGLSWDQFGRRSRYLNQTVSKKTLLRERTQIRKMTHSRLGWKPLPEIIGELNLHLAGWANYFRRGHPSKAFRNINAYVQERLSCFLRQRSQRPWRPPPGISFYTYLYDHLHLRKL